MKNYALPCIIISFQPDLRIDINDIVGTNLSINIWSLPCSWYSGKALQDLQKICNLIEVCIRLAVQ
jgi:hypothetical protein